MVTTPDGMPVAMVHSQNCTSDLNAWVNLFRENLESFGVKVDTNTLYGTLYNKALEGDADCGGLLPYCYVEEYAARRSQVNISSSSVSVISWQILILLQINQYSTKQLV